MKKIVICVLLVLLAFAMIVPVMAVRESFGKINVPSKSTQNGTTVPDTSEPDEETSGNVGSVSSGYTLSFKEPFFEDLADTIIELGDDQYAYVVMYVDGVRVDSMPESGSMQAHVVEFFVEGDWTYGAELQMSVNDGSVLRAYNASQNASSFMWHDFYTPIAFVLCGDVEFEYFGFFEP